jgi:hypothetical protein
MLTHGEVGEWWRAAHPDGNTDTLRFVTLGSGIDGSDADKEAHWFLAREFRLLLLRNTTDASLGEVVDFTRYDMPTSEPAAPSRSWNLMNVLNMKGSRPQDVPTLLVGLGPEDLALIGKHFPELVPTRAAAA